MSELLRLHDIPRRWASQAPDASALVEEGHAITYAELWRSVQDAAASLQRLGLERGDRLMVVGENCAVQVILLFAASQLGVWYVPVNARLTESELAQLQSHAQVRRVAFAIQASAAAAAHARAAGAVATALPGLAGLAFGGLASHSATVPEAEDPALAVAALVYTTGTTGQAKGVMLTHRNLLFVAHNSALVRAVGPEDRVYGGLPQAHVYGLSSVLLATLLAGGCVHLVPRFSVEALDAALVEEGLTILQGVPAMYSRLLAHRQGQSADSRWRLRGLFTGGAPLDIGLKQAVESHFERVLHNGYGLTESAPSIAHTALDAPRADDAVGRALPGIDIRIRADDGRPVTPGSAGDLWVRGPGVMAGYYRAPELTAQCLDSEGWLDTGDIARQAPDGALFILGRRKEMIIRSGFKVYPQEVEAVLNAFPTVLQSAVVGRRAADGNEEVIAFLELHPRCTLDRPALDRWLKDRLASYKRPAQLICLPLLPATASGKIRKSELPDRTASTIPVQS